MLVQSFENRNGLALAHSLSPALITLDVMMPGMDGYEFLRAVRAEHPNLPFLLVTAYADVDDAVSALQGGADDYLTKPFQEEEVLARVDIHLKLRRLQKELGDKNEQLRQEIAERIRIPLINSLPSRTVVESPTLTSYNRSEATTNHSGNSLSRG